jgi:hypothetical protein
MGEGFRSSRRIVDVGPFGVEEGKIRHGLSGEGLGEATHPVQGFADAPE